MNHRSMNEQVREKGNSSRLSLQKQDKVLAGNAGWSITDHPGRAATERNKGTFHPRRISVIHDSALGGKPDTGKPDTAKHDSSPEQE